MSIWGALGDIGLAVASPFTVPITQGYRVATGHGMFDDTTPTGNLTGGDQSRQDAEWAQQSGLRKKTLDDMTAAEQMLAARPAEIAQQFGQTKQKGLAEIHRQAANALGMSHNIGDAGGTGAMVQSGLNAGVEIGRAHV